MVFSCGILPAGFFTLNKREGGGELNRRGSSNVLSREVPVCSVPLLVLWFHNFKCQHSKDFCLLMMHFWLLQNHERNLERRSLGLSLMQKPWISIYWCSFAGTGYPWCSGRAHISLPSFLFRFSTSKKPINSHMAQFLFMKYKLWFRLSFHNFIITGFCIIYNNAASFPSSAAVLEMPLPEFIFTFHFQGCTQGLENN